MLYDLDVPDYMLDEPESEEYEDDDYEDEDWGMDDEREWHRD